MRDWRHGLLERAARGPVVLVTVIATEGSTPREAGARMIVHADGVDGSIGGGRLEFKEIAAAQALRARSHSLGPWHRDVHRIILGPDAQQCCGGVVTVLHELITTREAAAIATLPSDGAMARRLSPGSAVEARSTACVPSDATVAERSITSGNLSPLESPPPQLSPARGEGASRLRLEKGDVLIEQLGNHRTALHLYGAGHVARALERVLDGVPFAVRWIDIAETRFPNAVRGGVDCVVSETPADHARVAPPGAVHLVMTHDHDLDYAICAALLRRNDAALIGLIGSLTKRARFLQRMRRDGIDATALSKLVCPIGLAGVTGKEPAAIAIAIAAQLLAPQTWPR